METNQPLPESDNKNQSLMTLAQLAQVSPKKSEPQPIEESGDGLIERARNFILPSREEKRLAKLYQESEAIVTQLSQSNPAFGEKLGARIDALTKAGKLDEVPQVIIDAADEEKIKVLEREKPGWFTSRDAALTGFLDEATFGQLSKIFGRANEVIGGRNYEEVVAEKAEQFRLLSKAFPGWTTAGQVASYLIPGSPAKALFEGSAKLASKAALKATTSSLVKKMVSSPTALKALASGAIGAVGTGAVQSVRGALGQDLEDMDLDRGVNEGLIAAALGAGIGAAAPIAGMAIEKGAEAARPGVRAVAKSVDKFLGRASGELTGTSEASLRAYNRNPEALVKGAKTNAYDAGTEIVRRLENNGFNSEALKTANEILPMLGEVDAGPMINALKSVKKTNNPKLDPVVEHLNEWGRRFENQLMRGASETVATDAGLMSAQVPGKVKTMVPAELMNQWKRELQKATDSWGINVGEKEVKKFLDSQIHQAGRQARLAIEENAQLAMKSNDPALREMGELYIKNMRQAAKEAKIVDQSLKMLGKTEELRRKNAEGFFDRMFGKNRTFQLKRMEQLDAEMGTTFVEQARNYQYAKDLGGKSGPQATPSFFNANQNGRSVYGTVLGGAVGAANEMLNQGDQGFDLTSGAAAGAILTSPRVAAGVLGASGNISGFMRRMLANPEALNRLATGSIKTSESTAQRLAVPIEIQRIARSIQETLVKDGPRSAASLTRNIADTPYFLGLVHLYDVAEKAQTGKKTRAALERSSYEDAPEVATPR